MGRDSEPDAPYGASTDLWGDPVAPSEPPRGADRSAVTSAFPSVGAVDETRAIDPGRFGVQAGEELDPGASLTGPLPVVVPEAAVDGVLLGVIRRLRAQASRQAALAERLRGAESRPGPLADLAELAAVARRSRRDSDTLLVLAGAEPVRRSNGPVPLGQLVGEVLSGTEDAARVVVAPPAAATLDPVAADGLGQVLTELLAHAVATTAPGARIDVGSRWTADGGVAVEVLVAGLGLPADEAEDLELRIAGDHAGEVVAGDRVGLFVAGRLARRSGLRIGLLTDPAQPPAPGLALVAAVYCPATALLDPAAPAALAPADAGTGAFAFGSGGPPPEPAAPADPGQGDLPLFAAASAAVTPTGDEGVDALFGPLSQDALLGGEDSGTPIYAEVASAWFRSGGAHHAGEGDTEPDDWGGAGEWQAAAQRITQPGDAPLTASGLPQRRPGRQMVPPPRGEANGVGVGSSPSPERVPDRVRLRLSSYQRGLREGRHRATDDDAAEPFDPSDD